MVVDALSRMTMCSVTHVDESKKDVVKDVYRLSLVGVILEYSPNGGIMVHQNS